MSKCFSDWVDICLHTSRCVRLSGWLYLAGCLSHLSICLSRARGSPRQLSGGGLSWCQKVSDFIQKSLKRKGISPYVTVHVTILTFPLMFRILAFSLMSVIDRRLTKNFAHLSSPLCRHTYLCPNEYLNVFWQTWCRSINLKFRHHKTLSVI